MPTHEQGFLNGDEYASVRGWFGTLRWYDAQKGEFWERVREKNVPAVLKTTRLEVNIRKKPAIHYATNSIERRFCCISLQRTTQTSWIACPGISD